jgi:putative acetyltransferase
MQVSFRKIEPKDNAAVAAMIRQVFRDFKAVQKGTVFEDPTTDFLSDVFSQPSSLLLVAEVDGKVEGCCGIYPTAGLPKGCAELVKFYFSEKLRGKGYGRQVYQKCEEFAKTQGYTHLYIESLNDFSAAVKLYEKLGYVHLTQRLGNSGHFGCGIWMLKELE